MDRSDAEHADEPNPPDDSMRWDQRIVWICLHVLLVAVPLAIGNLTFLGIGGDVPLTFDRVDLMKVILLRAITLIALGAWVIGLLLQGGTVRRTKVDWLLFAFLVWVLLSSFFALHVPTAFLGKYRRFEGFITLVDYAALFLLTLQVVTTPARVRSLLRTLTFAAALAAVYGLVQYAGADMVDWGVLNFEANRSFSTFGNPDMFGGYVVLTLPIALALALTELERQWRFVYWAVTLMLSVALITSFTRGAWIAAAVAVVTVVIGARRWRASTGPVDWAFAGVAGIGVLVVVLKSLRSSSEVLNAWTRLVSIFEFGEGSAASRFEIWESAAAAIRESPLVGFGADNFRLLFAMFKTPEYVRLAGFQSVADNAHNYPLQLAAGVGIPGLVLLYAAIVMVLAVTRRRALGASGADGGEVSDGGASSATSGLPMAAVWAAALGYVVHLMFGISVVGTSTVFWVFLGILMAPVARASAVTATSLRPLRLAGVALIGVAVVAASALNVRYVVADRYYALGRNASFDVDRRAAYLRKAVVLNPYSDTYRNEIGLAYLNQVAGLVERIKSARAQGAEPAGMVDEAMRYTSLAERASISALRFNPAEYENYVFLAALYNSAGAHLDSAYLEKAVQIARLGIKVQKYGPSIRYQLARALANQGRTDEAIEQLEIAVELDPGFQDAQATLEVLRGKAEEAVTTE